jgi:hypothetical protein
MRGIVAVLQYGARKYGERNWERGMAWSRLERAAINHITSWSLREAHDEETKLSHLLHAGACVLFLIAYEIRGIGIDDRPIIPKPKAPNHDEKPRQAALEKVAAPLNEGQGKAPVAVVEEAREFLRGRAGVTEAEPLVINEAGFLKDEIRSRGEANIAYQDDEFVKDTIGTRIPVADREDERGIALGEAFSREARRKQNDDQRARLYGPGPGAPAPFPPAEGGQTVVNRVAVVEGSAAAIAAAVAKRATHYGLSGVKPSPSSEGSGDANG